MSDVGVDRLSRGLEKDRFFQLVGGVLGAVGGEKRAENKSERGHQRSCKRKFHRQFLSLLVVGSQLLWVQSTRWSERW